MKLNRLYLRNFRNYSECSVDFAPGINFIHGANAMGKTTLLEAIYLLITGRSFRTHHLADLIKFGEQEFYLEMLFEKSGIEQTLKMHYDGKTRKIIHNATQLASLSGLLGILHGVILTPEDHELVKGLPKTRRHFLDLHIARTNPLYLQHLSRYYKAMKQRNILLRQNERQTIEPFEQVMSESASFLSQTRQQTLDELSRLARHQPEPLTLHYKPSPFVTTQREREYELGLTTSGPHKEDFAIYLGEKPARVFGSEGQQRSCVAALKLAEWRRMAEITEETPFFVSMMLGSALIKNVKRRSWSI